MLRHYKEYFLILAFIALLIYGYHAFWKMLVSIVNNLVD